MLTSSGSNFRIGPVNFYRTIQNRTFMAASATSGLRSGLVAHRRFPQVGYKRSREWKEEIVF